MSDRFDYFIVFAEMRTGSNFLETNLNAFDGLTCHGEAFNPHFIGYPNRTDMLGMTQAERDADPARLVARVKQAPGLNGFRYFHDHDPRILSDCLADPRCAKIILTRNPVENYVSWKIAQATGQWKLTNVKKRKEARARFDAGEFERHLAQLQEFQLTLMNALQILGQTAFYLAYEDLQDLDVMNGLGRFLGQDKGLESLDTTLKRQNPSPLSDKVENFDEMQRALAGMDRFNLARTPAFEPRRGPAVPSYVAGAETPLLYMPMRSGPEAQVLDWMAALDGVTRDALQGRFNQKSLRHWQRQTPGHRSFTVLRHPVARVHAAFCERILATGPGSYAEIRRTLVRQHGVPLPDEPGAPDYDLPAHRAAFVAFLGFLRGNLLGQTGIRLDAAWAPQSTVLHGMGQFALPDMLVREEEMAAYLPALAQQVGRIDAPEPAQAPPDTPFALSEVYDSEIESLVSDLYQRDYLTFGYREWA